MDDFEKWKAKPLQVQGLCVGLCAFVFAFCIWALLMFYWDSAGLNAIFVRMCWLYIHGC